MSKLEHRVQGRLVDVVQKQVFPATLEIKGGKITTIIAGGKDEGPYLIPGLVDAHVHIESSMLLPSEFARVAVIHGTVATVSDPHEIANVLGINGVHFMLANGRKVPFYFNFGAPSCVPATSFESSGACLGPEEIKSLLDEKEVRYLSEMMNFPGVLNADEEVMQKLAAAAAAGKPVDGHAPGLRGEAVKIYASAGITTDHECFDIDEAREKIAAGMKILIREGSAARNFDTLIPLMQESPESLMFCSDDKHPDELLEGHINLLVKKALKAGYPLMDVLRAATLHPVRHYGLENGLLQEGDNADFIVVEDLETFRIMQTWIKGEKVAENGQSLISSVDENKPNAFEARMPKPDDLRVAAQDGKIRVINAIEGQLITEECLLEPRLVDGYVESDVERDILKMLVLNRYTPGEPSIGFIRNIGLKKGAIASTVAHDSHNIICVGTSDKDMLLAVELLIRSKGGIVAVDGEEHLLLPLPVAGIMSADNAWKVAQDYKALDAKAKALGTTLRAPFMTLSFMALLVIPALKLSDKGLFDGNQFRFTGIFQS
jgi:adenine deaminase